MHSFPWKSAVSQSPPFDKKAYIFCFGGGDDGGGGGLKILQQK
jgi:hypothetical protein